MLHYNLPELESIRDLRDLIISKLGTALFQIFLRLAHLYEKKLSSLFLILEKNIVSTSDSEEELSSKRKYEKLINCLLNQAMKL